MDCVLWGYLEHGTYVEGVLFLLQWMLCRLCEDNASTVTTSLQRHQTKTLLILDLYYMYLLTIYINYGFVNAKPNRWINILKYVIRVP